MAKKIKPKTRGKAKTARKPAQRAVGGPFLSTAVFCESILEGQDKTLSAVKIIDQVTAYLPADAPSDVPSKEHPIQFAQNMLISFRTGDGHGKHRLKVKVVPPNRDSAREIIDHEMELAKEPKNGGFNFRTQMHMSVNSSGIFWFDVFLDGRRVTRMPLNVCVERLPSPKKK